MNKETQDRLIKHILKLDEALQQQSREEAEELKATVDALSESTQLPREGIKLLAMEMSQSSHPAQQPSRKAHHLVLAFLVLFAGLLGFAGGRYIDDNPALMSVDAAKLNYAQVAQVLNSLTQIKHISYQYYAEYGNFPKSMQDMGLEPQDMTDGKYIKSVNINNKGAIIATLTDKFKDGRHVALVPGVTMGGTQISWQCLTDVAIEGAVPEQFMACEVRRPWQL